MTSKMFQISIIFIYNIPIILIGLWSLDFKFYRTSKEVIERFSVPVKLKDWHIEWKDYQPVPVIIDFGHKPWADPDIRDVNFHPKWNQLDDKIDRQSHLGKYSIDKDGFPLNPTGRTGVMMRGLLGRWGPNHAADPIVTRFVDKS